jgi:hypothetical protein
MRAIFDLTTYIPKQIFSWVGVAQTQEMEANPWYRLATALVIGTCGLLGLKYLIGSYAFASTFEILSTFLHNLYHDPDKEVSNNLAYFQGEFWKDLYTNLPDMIPVVTMDMIKFISKWWIWFTSIAIFIGPHSTIRERNISPWLKHFLTGPIGRIIAALLCPFTYNHQDVTVMKTSFGILLVFVIAHSSNLLVQKVFHPLIKLPVYLLNGIVTIFTLCKRIVQGNVLMAINGNPTIITTNGTALVPNGTALVPNTTNSGQITGVLRRRNPVTLENPPIIPTIIESS